MQVERFPKRRMLNKLDDIEWTLTRWSRQLRQDELNATDNETAQEAHTKALEADEVIEKVRAAKGYLRLFEPR